MPIDVSAEGYRAGRSSPEQALVVSAFWNRPGFNDPGKSGGDNSGGAPELIGRESRRVWR